ncbi:hypothetical protein KLEB273_gp020 [Bacillus phage vB_BauM_KLEB27-3]|nr:hypothetical protein KLEB273_gp020 [Bacillus phage vB_BauM_KLEB27-3]
MARIKVAVSPFFQGEFKDEFTGITFKSNSNGLNIYSIPSDADLSGIQKGVRKKILNVIEGRLELDAYTNVIEVEDVKEKKTPKEKKEEVKEVEVKEEDTSKEQEEKKDAETTKKKTKKSPAKKKKEDQ